MFSVFPAPDSPLRIVNDHTGIELLGDLRDQDTLAFSLLSNLLPRPFRHSKDVWWVFFSPSGAILRNYARSVDGQWSIWIERDEEKPRRSLLAFAFPNAIASSVNIPRIRLEVQTSTLRIETM